MTLYMSVKLYAAFNGSTWTDISSDASNLSWSGGIRSNNDIKSRVGEIGYCKFSLKNGDENSMGLYGAYSPGHWNCRVGFKAGLQIKVTVTFDGVERTKWYGRVYGISVTPGLYGSKITQVTAYDWMYQASNHKIYLPALVVSKRADEMLPLVVANMPIAPLSTNYMVCEDTFPLGFSTTTITTTAMAEFQKIAQSGFYYIYVTNTLASDEVLVLENREYRGTITKTTSVAAPSSESGYLRQEDGFLFLTEDGNKIIVNEITDLSLADQGQGLEYAYGKNVINKLTMTVNPSKVDSGASTVLTSLQNYIELAAGETKTNVVLYYRNPTTSAKCSGKDMVPPAATTDYKMYQNSDGTGTDRTADLVVAATYGADRVSYSLTNNNASKSYVTFLQARGNGIYYDDPVSRIYVNSSSQLESGSKEYTIDMPYQADPIFSDTFGPVIVGRNGNPFPEIRSLVFNTSISDTYGQMFMECGISKRYELVETVTGISDEFFVQGYECTVLENMHNDETGDAVEFKLFFKRAWLDTLLFALWDTAGGWDTDYGWSV